MIVQGRLMLEGHDVPPPGWVRIDGERLVEVGRGAPPSAPDAGDGSSVISPGFVDAHMHLPQMNAVGCDGLELLPWLEEVVFPAEMRWADASVADADAHSGYARLLRSGTLGFAGYLTSHHAGVASALSAARSCPLRGIVGQVLMDRGGPPELLQPGSGRELAGLGPTEDGRTALSVNPRFAIACSDEVLRDAAERAGSERFIQTHLAESRAECETVARLFPDDPSYTAVYDRHGLLGPRTLLAHAIHLTESELALIAKRRAVLVHCPAANTFLRSGTFDLDATRRHGIRLALGSDVAAGPDTAMPRVARAMIEVAKLRALEAGVTQGRWIPTPAEAWAMITRGNAELLGFNGMGRLEPGAAADLLVLRPDLPMDRHLVGRLIYTWSDDYIETVVLNGRLTPPRR